jgi:aspartate racemase
MAKLVAQTDANCDQDHIRILVDHNPAVPNRHEAIAGDAKPVIDALVVMARTLERAGADFLVMVCNTAHAFQSEISAAVDIPFVSIVDEVVSELGLLSPAGQGVGIMAAQGCLRAGFYQNALNQAGLKPICWTECELTQFMTLLYQIKAGDDLTIIRPKLEHLAQVLVQRGAHVLLAACTEIPLVLQGETAPAPLLSSTDILVSRTIAYAVGARALPGS